MIIKWWLVMKFIVFGDEVTTCCTVMLPHPQYSPDLAHCNFYLFLWMKDWLNRIQWRFRWLKRLCCRKSHGVTSRNVLNNEKCGRNLYLLKDTEAGTCKSFFILQDSRYHSYPWTLWSHYTFIWIQFVIFTQISNYIDKIISYMTCL
jgi:hypothetical protein